MQFSSCSPQPKLRWCCNTQDVGGDDNGVATFRTHEVVTATRKNQVTSRYVILESLLLSDPLNNLLLAEAEVFELGLFHLCKAGFV